MEMPDFCEPSPCTELGHPAATAYAITKQGVYQAPNTAWNGLPPCEKAIPTAATDVRSATTRVGYFRRSLSLMKANVVAYAMRWTGSTVMTKTPIHAASPVERLTPGAKAAFAIRPPQTERGAATNPVQ